MGTETSNLPDGNGLGGTNRPEVTNKTYLIQYFTKKNCDYTKCIHLWPRAVRFNKLVILRDYYFVACTKI